MTVEVLTALLLVVVPIAFNLAFFELSRAFDYPDILRKEPDEILRRFDAGGAGLILRWEALLVSALLMLPLAALLAVVLGASPALSVLSVVVGSAAALVQGLGLVRWPFAVPELARRYVAAPDGPAGDATRQTVTVVFATLHRLLGVGIGEHLGYLFTGLWTLLVAASILSTDRPPGLAGHRRHPDRDRAPDRHAGVRGAERARGLGAGRHDRADRLHRLVDLADRARDLPAPLSRGRRAGGQRQPARAARSRPSRTRSSPYSNSPP